MFTSVSSIGSFCQSAYQLRRAARDVINTPLDWTFVHYSGLLKCIQTDFESFGEWNALRLTPDLTRVIDSATGVVLYHQFERDADARVKVYELRQMWEKWTPKRDHLVANWRSITGRHLFIWTVDKWFREMIEPAIVAEEVFAALRKRFPDCGLMFVQVDGTVQEPWGEIMNSYVPKTEAWQGSNNAWDVLLKQAEIYDTVKAFSFNGILLTED